MVLKSKRPSAGASRGGKKTILLSKPRGASAVETIEARLVRKAAVADTKTFATKSLGKMTLEKRHKLLYGD